MYSGSVKYRVYKKDISHYRVEVFDPATKTWKPVLTTFPERLTLFGCTFFVDEKLRKETITKKLDGADAHVHAWIVCNGFILKDSGKLKRLLYYNPARVDHFVNRETMKPVDYAETVSINQNTLTYQ